MLASSITRSLILGHFRFTSARNICVALRKWKVIYFTSLVLSVKLWDVVDHFEPGFMGIKLLFVWAAGLPAKRIWGFNISDRFSKLLERVSWCHWAVLFLWQGFFFLFHISLLFSEGSKVFVGLLYLYWQSIIEAFAFRRLYFVCNCLRFRQLLKKITLYCLTSLRIKRFIVKLITGVERFHCFQKGTLSEHSILQSFS